MKCPHCLTDFHDTPSVELLGTDSDGEWAFVKRTCSACKRLILHLVEGPFSEYRDYDEGFAGALDQLRVEYLVRPKAANRPPAPPEVPSKFADDYKESCLVLADSPKASAALSRRCLQHLLREEAKVKPGNLANEIQEIIDSGKLPSYIVTSIDAVRNIGNFAAHPMKSQASGEVLPVEPGEADWNLDVLESLFDFYFVQPAILKKKRDALNQKLQTAGKPAMK